VKSLLSFKADLEQSLSGARISVGVSNFGLVIFLPALDFIFYNDATSTSRRFCTNIVFTGWLAAQMTSEQSKTAPGAPEQPFTTTAAASTSVPQFPQFPAGYAPALPPGYPPFFAFPPPTDGQQGEGTPPALPYPLLYTPPGMVYAFSPPVPAATQATSAEASRPKRRQVKMACTNCAAACKRCDEARPCERCKKYGIADSCVDGQRKERKKGVKRGPYKRKNKSPSDNPGLSYSRLCLHLELMVLLFRKYTTVF
jgi:hypothetical protein